MPAIRAFAINCTLKPSPEQSNTDSLLEIVLGGLQKEGVEVEATRAVDHEIKPGVESDMGEGDEWPPDPGEDRLVRDPGDRHADLAGQAVDIGFTVPGQSWTYWNMGPGPGPSFLETDEGHDWSRTTAEAAAQNLLSVARALQASPVPPPPR